MLEQYFQLYQSRCLPHPLKSIIWNHPLYLSTHTEQVLVYYSEFHRTCDILYSNLINYILSQSKHILLHYIKTFYYKNKNSSTRLSHVGSYQSP